MSQDLKAQLEKWALSLSSDFTEEYDDGMVIGARKMLALVLGVIEAAKNISENGWSPKRADALDIEIEKLKERVK